MRIYEVYKYTHNAVKVMNGGDILKNLSKIMSASMERKDYLPTGLTVPGTDIFLGIDFIPRHVHKFETIVKNSFIVDNFCMEQADLSRVLLPLYVNNKHVATLTEDVSKNGTYIVNSTGMKWLPHYFPLEVVGLKPEAFMKAIFSVYKEDNEPYDPFGGTRTVKVRFAVIDLDHIQFDQHTESTWVNHPLIKDPIFDGLHLTI